MRLCAAFAPTLDTPDHVRIAESLGYERAWLYDTPQQSPDIWMILALAADRTATIGLGPGVLIPTLRHPMVNAAGAAALARLAPGRVAVGFGTGYTARRALGQATPISWSFMIRYITAFRGLLRGETVEWDGGAMRMLHSATAASVPVDLPVYLGAVGPKGIEVARQLSDGIFIASFVPPDAPAFENVAYLAWGTVLAADEQTVSPRVRLAAGPGVAQVYHVTFEIGGREAVLALPGGDEWLAVLDRVPEQDRHLAVHDQHCLALNDADAAAWVSGGHTLVPHTTLTGTPKELRDKIGALESQGVTELVYQPAGDIPFELEAFARAAFG